MIRNSRRVVVLAVAGAVAIAPVISGCGAGDTPQSASPTQLTEGVNVTLPTGKASAAQIDLRHMFLLGPQPGRPIPAGTSMALYGVLINQVKGRQDRLVAVGSPAFGGEAKIDGGGLVLPPAAADGTGSLVRLLGKPSQTPTPTPPAKKKTQEPGGAASGAPTPEQTGAGATPDTSETPASGNTTGPEQSSPPATPGGDQPLVVLPQLTQELLAGATVPLTMRFEHAGSVQFQVPVVPRQGDYETYPLPSTPAPTPQTPGGQTPGGQTPGGEQPGGQTPGTETPGGNTSEPPAGGTETPAGA
ncbi:hypothetical protein E1293_41330 [Actinomadura darangshiensis]|uniref:Copper chaperone PCu(A)C n=1 Tax=Actinomadura darangshiensis TaxID=705336 RepID=A0A4R5A142_9ACTN|nr:hypothetical protein [Actinomadura darangshiensis]TDD64620.1 hypothetical protein E1293_41330 [Actinomadura darangshiensis]